MSEKMYEMATFRERTLANAYQPRQHLPPNFHNVLKEYAREVLRAQPDDVLQWSANYFKQLALAADTQQVQQSSPSQVAFDEDKESEELVENLIRVFAELDSDNTGVLPIQTVKNTLLSKCGMTLTQVLYVLTSTSVGDKDMVDYEVFARKSSRAIQFFQETHHEFGVSNVEDATVHGLSRQELEVEFLRLLRYADAGETGLLPIDQYCTVLMDAPYHLTHRDLRLLRIEATCNAENAVDYEAELACMFDRLLLAEQFFLFDERV